MDRLKNRRDFIPNGFWIVTPQISHEPFGNQAWDFDELCRQEQGRRARNPRFNLATDLPTIANEVDAQNAARLRTMRGAEIYLASPTDPGGIIPNLPAPRKSWRGVAGGVKDVAVGVGVLLDWLGDGAQPVPGDVAESRAGVCAVCPQNQPGDIMAIFTRPVAEKIRAQLAIRKNLQLSTSHDDKLQVCEACHCPLRLKVHVPLGHIEAHLGDTAQRLDKVCWILAELGLNGN